MQPNLQQLQLIRDDEQYILSTIMLKGAFFDPSIYDIAPHNFTDLRHKAIFSIMCKLDDNDMTIGPAEIYRQSDPDTIGDALYLAEIMINQSEYVCSLLELGYEPEPVSAYCQRIKQYSAVFRSGKHIAWEAPPRRRMSEEEVLQFLYGDT